MTNETQYVTQPSFGSRLGRAVRRTAGCLLRLLILVIVVVGLGAAVYYAVIYGAPILYREYVYPVQQNTTRLGELEASLALGEQQDADRLLVLQDRLETLELKADADRESFSSLQAELGAVGASLTSVQATQIKAQTAMDDLMAAQAAIGVSSESMQAAQTEAEERLGDAQAALDDLVRYVAEIDKDVEGLAQAAIQSDENVKALDAELEAVASSVAEVRDDRHLLRALDLLTRAQLYLAQGNAGLARSEVAVARSLLSDLQPHLPARQQDAVAVVLSRLNLVVGSLPGAPDLARGDLDLAWKLLLRVLDGTGAGVGFDLTPTLTITTSPTLTTTETVTPTETTTP